MRAYIFATAAALLVAAPGLTQPTTPGVSGGTEPNPRNTEQSNSPRYSSPAYSAPANPQESQVPPRTQPYSQELNQSSKNGPMREQPNQNGINQPTEQPSGTPR